MAKWIKGPTKIIKVPKIASVTITAGNIALDSGSGTATIATNQSNRHIGIHLQSVASTDSDFADNTEVAIEVPLSPECEFIADVTGTLATTDILSSFDLSDASTVNKAGTTYGVVACKGFVSSSKGRFSLNSNISYQDPTWE